MIQNLPEQFLYERLPAGLVDLDARGLIQAVVGGYEDRVNDLRSYSGKLELLFQTSGLPETGNNVVFVDIQSDQGKVYTRSLDIQDDTPADGTTALTVWALAQIGDAVQSDNISNVRYGRDLLRLVDANTLDYLAATIGAVLFKSSALSAASQTIANQQILQTYFPRLKIKGTADSFNVLGRILGFDDVKVTPLYGRLSPRVPNDIGNPANDADFSPEAEYQPQQAIDDFYNPLKTNDGPYFSWSGTVAPGTASTQFCTEVVNGFNPWVEVSILSVEHGTVTYPSAGSYALGSSGTNSVGGPHKKAYVEAVDVLFRALGEGQYFNGIEIHVEDSGTNKIITVADRLSAIKYRSSYFDLALAAEFDSVEELYGRSAMRRNKDLAANPTLTSDGTAVSPYRPWWSGSISTGLSSEDFLVMTGTEIPVVVTARVQSSGTDRQLNTDALVAAGVQVIQAFEEVRPATRQARKAGIGFLIRDEVGYAAYTKETRLFTTASGTNYSGTSVDALIQPYYALIALQVGTNREYAESVFDQNSPNGYLYAAPGFAGSYDFDTGNYNFTVSTGAGTEVFALWKPASTEVIRTEPASGTTKAYQARPEDQENGNKDEVADDFPWRRDLTLGGEAVDLTIYNPITPDSGLETVESIMAVPGHDGAYYNVYAINSASGIPQLVAAARTTGVDYQPGLPAVAYSGQLKNLADVTETPGQTDLERFFEPGAALYTVGNVQGVFVADPNKFFSSAHRQDLVAWFPFNEHVDADLPPVDHSASATALVPTGLVADSRRWDEDRGWYLKPTLNSYLLSTKLRFTGNEVSLSFWIKPGVSSDVSTIFQYGPVSAIWNGTAGSLSVYYRNVDNVPVLVGFVYPNDFTFVALTVSATEAVFAFGDASTPITAQHVFGDFAAFEETDIDIVLQGTDYGISDLRIWDTIKTEAELDSIRDYAPGATQTAYQVGSFLSLNRRDRYALKVLPCGLVAAAPLPGWYREQRLGYATRYDSLGRYEGESRFKEVGLGGGMTLPASFKLGQQFYDLTADGVTVVSTETGIEPGIDDLWREQNAPPNYLKVIQTGSTSFDVFVSSGTSDPWPNQMIATNPASDAVWVHGDDGYIYEVTLASSGTGAALRAALVARQRTDAELEISSFGTDQWPTLRYSEQPTGAESILTDTGEILAVAAGGSIVYQKAYAGTQNTPPLYLYLNSRTAIDVPNAYDFWTDPSVFGDTQVPPTAALQENGELVFETTGVIVPGNYLLTVISGNIGKVDADFDGFAVDITVDATVIQKRLCEGLTGYNFTGTDVFEMDIGNGVSGAFLTSFRWTNTFSDPSRGEARQLAIHSFSLERLTTELYQVSIATSGTIPDVTLVNTGTYAGTTPGGWLAAINSYGSVAEWQHESLVYPSNDTLTLTSPLSEILTATTIERREDVLGPSDIVLTNGTVTAMPSFGSIVDAATGLVPLWLWSGAVTGDSAVIAAKLPSNSPAVQAVVSLYGTIGEPMIWSDYGEASTDHSNTVKLPVSGLLPNKTYYYAIATAGSIATSFIGKFKTWDETTKKFTFALASCSLNTITAGVNPGVFDTIRAKDPLFFLHMGDLHYNDGGNEPTTVLQYHNCYDKVFQLSARQKQFWQNMAIPYMWDDHDYGPNNSDKTWAHRLQARLAYQETVPHYPLPDGSGDISPYFSFAVGRCKFIVTDLRSEADVESAPLTAGKTLLGTTQKAWLKQQFLDGKNNYAITFWVSTMAWGGAAGHSETWSSYNFERRELIDFVMANEIKGLFILSGDMHACALDDGTNNAFGTGSTGGMVAFQAAPLQQAASRKGTPYLHGPFPGAGSATKNQYGLITVWDDGVGTPYLTFEGFDDTASTDLSLLSVSFYGTQSPKP